MEKPKFDERAVKIAKEILSRELYAKNNRVPNWYLDGYYCAICDFLLRYSGEDVKAKDLDALYDKESKFKEVKK
ncbi:MAG: hypothetical protein WC402_03135 [Candidatus Pacearchaeota archaeon]|jgi:hypothetical protein